MSVYSDRLADLTPEQKHRAEQIFAPVLAALDALAHWVNHAFDSLAEGDDHFADDFRHTLGGAA